MTTSSDGLPIFMAGDIADVCRASGRWAFLDLGFSRKKASCGLAIDDESPTCIQYCAAIDRLQMVIRQCDRPLNLVIEAPLSVAFSARGNPTGRRIELRGREHRYWYAGVGASMMVAAMFLIRSLRDTSSSTSVRVFEGFASFKPAGSISTHVQDVLALKAIVDDPVSNSDAIVAPERLRLDDKDTVSSAGVAFGMDFGVPPVLVAYPASRW